MIMMIFVVVVVDDDDDYVVVDDDNYNDEFDNLKGPQKYLINRKKCKEKR